MPHLDAPISHVPDVFFLTFSLTFMVPIGCALYPQRSTITTARLQTLEKEKWKKLSEQYEEKVPSVLYFNKGL